MKYVWCLNACNQALIENKLKSTVNGTFFFFKYVISFDYLHIEFIMQMSNRFYDHFDIE